LLKRYANVDDDPEAVPPTPAFLAAASVAAAGSPVWPPPASVRPQTHAPALAGWPFDAAEAQRRQAAAGGEVRRKIPLAEGLALEFVLIPAGEFLMGSSDPNDAAPLERVRIDRAFWMATGEIENRAYALFDPAHDSRVEDKNAYQFGIHGYPANRPEQPVVRVSWDEAMAYCRWLSARIGERVTLPTEAQWEYACRAGTATPFNFGDLGTDFSPHANLADAKLAEFASDPYTVDVPLKNPTPYDDWIPKDARFNDRALLTIAPGRFRPNAWGLYDMHGNAAEWTGSFDGERRLVRGGSWRDLPKRSTSSFRITYAPWQRVFNVGFRVISEGPRTMAQR
jgi:formylglycine-generating enzyme required for sulfatase activity